MKKELLTMLASSALFAYSANAEIVLTEDLSVSGYIDVAVVDGADDEKKTTNTNSSVAEFELGFAFTPAESKWSAVAELSFDNNRTVNNIEFDDKNSDGIIDEGELTAEDNNAKFEKVMVTYAYSDALSFTAGNMLTYQGFEAADATGLYQFSYQGIGGNPVYSAAYAPGASVDYVTDSYELGWWIGGYEGEADASYEYYAAYTGVENLTVKFIYADDPGYETYNTWASYDYGDFTFAAEYTSTDNEDTEDDLEVFMALVYYAYGDAGLTLRYSSGEYSDDDFEGDDFTRFTVSPSYAFSDNVFGLVEYSVDDIKGDGTDTSLAAELIFSF
jgi:hypothetical protein